MSKKQNCDPNRSTRVLSSSNNMIEKKLHNSSLNTISSTQQSYSIKQRNNKDKDQLIKSKQIKQTKQTKQTKQSKQIKQNKQKNKNSRILAEIKQSKQTMMTKRQGTKSTNISTTRSNYKPKFILKQLINQQNYNRNHNLYQQQEHNEYQQSQQSQQLSQHQQQYEQYSHQRESLCQDYYYMQKLQQKQNINQLSNTFNNSPLGSQSCYKLTKRSKPQQQTKINYVNQQKPKQRPTFITTYQQQNQQNTKSAIMSKRTHNEKEDRTTRHINHQQDVYEELNNLNKPLQMNAFNKQKLKYKYNINNNNNNINNNNNRRQQLNKNNKNNKTQQQQSLQHDQYQQQQHQQYPSQVLQYQMYQQASTVEYPKKLFNKKGREQSQQSQNQGYEFQSRIKSISSTNPCRQQRQQQHKQMRSISINNNNNNNNKNNNYNENPNYKTAYLQTKKQLQIRSAYFNQAIQLCKHIIGNMKVVIEEEYAETQSDRVMWCHQRCQDILSAFEEWTEK